MSISLVYLVLSIIMLGTSCSNVLLIQGDYKVTACSQELQQSGAMHGCLNVGTVVQLAGSPGIVICGCSAAVDFWPKGLCIAFLPHSCAGRTSSVSLCQAANYSVNSGGIFCNYGQDPSQGGIDLRSPGFCLLVCKAQLLSLLLQVFCRSTIFNGNV